MPCLPSTFCKDNVPFDRLLKVRDFAKGAVWGRALLCSRSAKTHAKQTGNAVVGKAIRICTRTFLTVPECSKMLMPGDVRVKSEYVEQ